VPYSLSGNAWPNPQLITLSFVPDGTNLGGVTSNLFATFNAKWSTSTWENQIIKAAQVWAQQTNINFTVISDSGVDEGSGNYLQGDPTIGDIRISGFNFGSSALGMAYLPPPVNNYSIAGDISFNTGQTFNVGSAYDLFTVAVHEMGHALGLLHSSSKYAVMCPTYWTTFTALGSDDIAGIRAVYSGGSPRSYDAFSDTNTSFSTAANLTSLISSDLTALETGLSISFTSQKEYFSITAPAGTTGALTVTAESCGLSLLAPSLTVYNSSQAQIATTSGSGELGSTISLHITGVSAGQQYYVAVGGANTTSFGTGNYALSFQFGSITPPAVPLPNKQVVDGNPIQGGGGQNFSTGEGFQHGAGCNCAACQAARAALVQRLGQQQILMAESQQEQQRALASAVRSRAAQDRAQPNSLAGMQAFVFQHSKNDSTASANLSTAPMVIGLNGSAANTDVNTAASWVQACEAFFSAGNSNAV
jgi:hypothetical protein